MKKDILNLLREEEAKRWSKFKEERMYGRKYKQSEAYGGYIAAREIREAVEKLIKKR